MTVSDVILGKRHLLGFVIPGATLVLAVILGFSPEPPLERLKALSPGEWALIVVVGMLAGHAFGHLNFRVMTWLGKGLHGNGWLAIYDERYWMDDKRRLIARVREAVGKVTGDLPEVGGWSEDKLFDFCKLALLEKTKVWSAKLDERETEINLLAMNVIPGTVLLLTWALKGRYLGASWIDTQVFLPLVGLLFPLLLLRNLEPLRCREREVVFEMFLALPVLPRIDSPPPPAASSP